MEGRLYPFTLRFVRLYRRLRRPLLKPIPTFLKKRASDLFGYLSPFKLLLTAVAIWSCPSHFFKNFRQTVSGTSTLFPDPWELLTSASAVFAAVVGLVLVNVSKATLLEIITVVSLLMPIWAIPICWVFIIVRRAREPKGLDRYYKPPVNPKNPSQQADAIMEAWDKASVPKPTFEATPSYELLRQRVLGIDTYLALDWGQSFLGYAYVTVSSLITSAFCVLFLEFVFISFLALTLSSVAILQWIAVIIGGGLVVPCIEALLSGTDSVFVEPYYQLLSHAVPHPDREAIEAEFEPIVRLIKERGMDVGYYDEEFGFAIPSDELFIRELSSIWQERRALFLEHEAAAFQNGAKARARFLIERQKQAEGLRDLAYRLRMSWETWERQTPFMLYDLKRMLLGLRVSENTSESLQRAREQGEKVNELLRKRAWNRREDEVAMPPKFFAVDGEAETTLLGMTPQAPSMGDYRGVVTIANPTRLLLRVRPLWLTVAGERCHCVISLRRGTAREEVSFVALKKRAKEDVEVHIKFSVGECPIVDGELWFTSNNRLELFPLRVEFPPSRCT